MTDRTTARSGVYAVVDGGEHPVVATAPGRITVADATDIDRRRRRRSAKDGRRLVDVPQGDVARLFRRSVMANWDDHEVRVVGPTDGDILTVEWDGGPAWPTSVGLDGNQRDGWRGRVPRHDLGDLRIDEIDIPTTAP